MSGITQIRDGRIVGSSIGNNLFKGKTPTAEGFLAPIGYAFLDDGGVFTDDTVDANDAGANDVPLMPAAEAVNDAFYFGDGYTTAAKFSQIVIDMGTAGVGGSIAWEYWNGAWVALTVTDGTAGFTAAGQNTVSFTPPADWVTTLVNGQTRFWVRARVTAANFVTIPLATQIWLGTPPLTLANATDGSFTTVSGTGQAEVAGGGANIGYIIVDLGSIKTVMVGGKIGIWSTASDMYVLVNASDDGVTYHNTVYMAPNIALVTATSEQICDLIPSIVRGRYVRLQFWAGGAMEAFLKLYEVFGLEVTIT